MMFTTEGTTQAQQAVENAVSLYSNIGVGDKVIASYDNGSQFVNCRVYAIEETVIKFLWNDVVFSVEKELAAMSTLLVQRFNREETIREIMALLIA